MRIHRGPTCALAGQTLHMDSPRRTHPVRATSQSAEHLAKGETGRDLLGRTQETAPGSPRQGKLVHGQFARSQSALDCHLDQPVGSRHEGRHVGHRNALLFRTALTLGPVRREGSQSLRGLHLKSELPAPLRPGGSRSPRHCAKAVDVQPAGGLCEQPLKFVVIQLPIQVHMIVGKGKDNCTPSVGPSTNYVRLGHEDAFTQNCRDVGSVAIGLIFDSIK
jgi:hypothetical protein